MSEAPETAGLPTVAEVVRRVAELPNRTSPDDWPEAMLVTADELTGILNDVLREAVNLHTEYQVEVERLQTAIRAHRDARGDDRCWRDDETLYKALPEGYTPPARDSSVELDRCRKFIAARENPATEYVSPQRKIQQTEAQLTKAAELILELLNAYYKPAREWLPVENKANAFLASLNGVGPTTTKNEKGAD